MWNWSLGKAPGGVGRAKIPPRQALGVPSKASRSGLSIRAPRATKGHILLFPHIQQLGWSWEWGTGLCAGQVAPTALPDPPLGLEKSHPLPPVPFLEPTGIHSHPTPMELFLLGVRRVQNPAQD